MTSITATSTSGYSPLTITFSFTTDVSVSSVAWNFGDGNTSSQNSPEHVFDCAGIYSVSVVINKDLDNEESAIQTNYISVLHKSPKMPENTCCLGPYTIECIDCSSGSGTQFVDDSKSYKLCNNCSCTSTCQDTFGDTYNIIASNDSCPSCLECFLEHKTKAGRIYTLVPTGCSVFITDYEMKQECGECLKEASEFCFSLDLCSPTTTCSSIFSFDNHIFSVTGTSQSCSDDFDCGDCWTQQNAFFDDVFGGIPESSRCTNDDNEETVSETQTAEKSPQVIWYNAPTGNAGVGVDCNAEFSIEPTGSSVVSQQNPAIDIIPSGHAIIAFEERFNTGITKISLALVKTSVPNTITNWRTLSFGTLVNDNNVDGNLTFRIYDNVKIEVNNVIAFLDGPLVSKKYTIKSVTHVIGSEEYFELTLDSVEITP